MSSAGPIENRLRPELPFRTSSGLAYAVSGSGPALLTVHGAPGTDHTLFRPFLDPLANWTRLVYLDLPGHGQSAAPTDYSLEAMAESLDGVRASLGVERVVLLGSSYGGFLSLIYALAHPEHVSGLVLVDTAASYAFRAESLAVAHNRATARQLAALERLWDPHLPDDDAFHAAWRDALPLYFARLAEPEVHRLADAGRYRVATRRRVLPTLQSFDVRARLGEIDAPALVIVARHDWIISIDSARALASDLPHARLVVFEESGHYPFIEENQRFLDEVSAWLGETG